MKPSDDPRSPFNENYQAKINWRSAQIQKNNSLTTTKNLEAARMKDPNHDKKVGVVLNQHERLMPKKFHIYSRAGK